MEDVVLLRFTFCASEIMGDHCPIRQSHGPLKKKKGLWPVRVVLPPPPAPLAFSLFPRILPFHSHPLPVPSAAVSHRPLPLPSQSSFCARHNLLPLQPFSSPTVVRLQVLSSPFPRNSPSSASAFSSHYAQSLDTAHSPHTSPSSTVPLPASRSRAARSHHHSLCPSVARGHSLPKRGCFFQKNHDCG